MTPGESAISGMKFRPSSGSVTTFFCSTTKLTVPRLDCSSGAAAVTFTDSVDVADLQQRDRGISGLRPARRRRPGVTRRSPLFVTVIEYVPGCRAKK